jgi:hypothetical protein
MITFKGQGLSLIKIKQFTIIHPTQATRPEMLRMAAARLQLETLKPPTYAEAMSDGKITCDKAYNTVRNGSLQNFSGETTIRSWRCVGYSIVCCPENQWANSGGIKFIPGDELLDEFDEWDLFKEMTKEERLQYDAVGVRLVGSIQFNEGSPLAGWVNSWTGARLVRENGIEDQQLVPDASKFTDISVTEIVLGMVRKVIWLEPFFNPRYDTGEDTSWQWGHKAHVMRVERPQPSIAMVDPLTLG